MLASKHIICQVLLSRISIPLSSLTPCLDPFCYILFQITPDQFRTKDISGSDDLANMFDFFCRVDQRCSIDLTTQLNPRLRSLNDWLMQNMNAIDRAMDYQKSPLCQAMMGL